LTAQLTLAAVVLAPTVSLANVTVLCQHNGNPDAPPAPARQMPDCLLCFVCHNATGAIGLLTSTSMLLAPTTTPVARAVALPPATAPPRRFVTAACPRGPPVPI
jgi:hypothetical protein